MYVLTKYDLVGMIMQESPRATELLTEYGLHCVGCFLSEHDTLATGAQMHGMTEEEIDEMIEEINQQLEKEAREQKIPN